MACQGQGMRTGTKRRKPSSGQGSVEMMLVTSVVVIAVVAASILFVPAFQNGTEALASDVVRIFNGHVPKNTGPAPSLDPYNVSVALDMSGNNANGNNQIRKQVKQIYKRFGAALGIFT